MSNGSIMPYSGEDIWIFSIDLMLNTEIVSLRLVMLAINFTFLLDG